MKCYSIGDIPSETQPDGTRPMRCERGLRCDPRKESRMYQRSTMEINSAVFLEIWEGI